MVAGKYRVDVRPHPAALLRERLGNIAGWLAAPVFALVSAARHARTFHPEGVVLSADVEPLPTRSSARRSLGERLRGPALVRFSSALWKHERERRDALGCAIRFRSDVLDSPRPSAGDQDLLFATTRSPWTMLVSPLATRVHDYLTNRYFATAPFDVPGLGRAKLRLTPEHASTSHGSRSERLLGTVALGRAALRLEVRRTWRARYHPVARVVLRHPADIDQEALRFDPFRTGRGIQPRGFVHALRRGAYAASQGARPRCRGI